MHNVIFQISTEPIDKDLYIDTDLIEAGETVSIDYAYSIAQDKRQVSVNRLLRVLPQDMFTLDKDGNALVYNGGFDVWKKSYAQLLQSKAAAITQENVMKWTGPTCQLQKAIVNPLETDCLFVVDFGSGYSLAERSKELMLMVEQLEAGQRIYIGAILGYHF